MIYDANTRGFARADRISRRAFVVGGISLLAAFAASCSPLKILLNRFPARFRSDRRLQEAYLALFVRTVVPGADPGDANLTRIYFDDYYPFLSYVPFFVSDLESRSNSLFAHAFDALTQRERELVIEDGLRNGDTVARRLYHGAVFMARTSVYAGIYDDDRGCPHIGFTGRNLGFAAEDYTYSDFARFCARELTLTGNPN